MGFDGDAIGDTIGGTVTGAGNLLSGNSYGLSLYAYDEALIEGNMIGTSVSGDAAVPNEYGVYIRSGTGNTIGGTASGEGNLISGNTHYGIWLFGSRGVSHDHRRQQDRH